MPAGLDGAEEGIDTRARRELLAGLTATLLRTAPTPGSPLLVGIDGEAGSGKSTLADELAASIEATGLTTLRASIDSFHRPRAKRWARGQWSPVGYYLDSHQLETFRSLLLEPALDGRPVVTEVFDEPADSAIEPAPRPIEDVSVVLVDGLFLLRPELVDVWDHCIHLTAPRRLEARRTAWFERDLPEESSARAAEIADRLLRFERYVDGWNLYRDTVKPHRIAGIVIDNDDLAEPRFVHGGPGERPG